MFDFFRISKILLLKVAYSIKFVFVVLALVLVNVKLEPISA